MFPPKAQTPASAARQALVATRFSLNTYDLSWDDDAVTSCIPLKVKTREPRGPELESYANLDAFIRVEAVASATSRK